MSRRRKQQLAAAGAGALILAVVLAAVLAGGSGSSHSISVPAAQTPTGNTDPRAQDRAQITALALAYQAAVLQDAAQRRLCSYLDPQSRALAIAQAKHTSPGPSPCWVAALALSGDAAGGQPAGIDPSTLQFSLPSQRVRCDLESPPVSLPASQQGLSWAAAEWAAGTSQEVTFVKEDNRWWIDLLLCHA